MSNKKNVSIRSIAKVCDVSPSTVSRVLNGTGRISEKTRQAVLNVIETSGYTMEQNMKKIFSNHIIGIIFPYVTTYFHPQLLDKLTKGLRKKGYTPVVLFHNNQTELEIECLKIISELDVKGLIINPASRMVPPNIDTICGNIPKVFIEAIPDNVHYTVQSDNFSGGQLAAIEFLNKKCQNPLIICRATIKNRPNFRLNGFLDIYKKNGISIPKDHILTVNNIKGSFTEAKDLIRYAYIKEYKFDCVFADSDWKAFGSLVALQELNFKIPEDIKIIGYDYSDITQYTYLPITSISQEIDDFSSKIQSILYRLIDGDCEIPKNNIIPASLKNGKTT